MHPKMKSNFWFITYRIAILRLEFHVSWSKVMLISNLGPDRTDPVQIDQIRPSWKKPQPNPTKTTENIFS